LRAVIVDSPLWPESRDPTRHGFPSAENREAIDNFALRSRTFIPFTLANAGLRGHPVKGSGGSVAATQDIKSSHSESSSQPARLKIGAALQIVRILARMPAAAEVDMRSLQKSNEPIPIWGTAFSRLPYELAYGKWMKQHFRSSATVSYNNR
jgi:hypothetical protein